MTDNQRKNLQGIAKAITTGHLHVSESFAIGQVALVTRRTWSQAMEGLTIMRREKIIPEGFIVPETDGVLARMAANNPALKTFFDKFDVIPGTTETLPFSGFCRQKGYTFEAVPRAFSLPEF